jgi:hypothetical protein
MRHNSAAPDVTSMKLSNPKPTSETLPAMMPAMTATHPSRLFHAMVNYSRRRPGVRGQPDSWLTIVGQVPVHAPSSSIATDGAMDLLKWEAVKRRNRQQDREASCWRFR